MGVLYTQICRIWPCGCLFALWGWKINPHNAWLYVLWLPQRTYSKYPHNVAVARMCVFCVASAHSSIKYRQICGCHYFDRKDLFWFCLERNTVQIIQFHSMLDVFLFLTLLRMISLFTLCALWYNTYLQYIVCTL